MTISRGTTTVRVALTSSLVALLVVIVLVVVTTTYPTTRQKGEEPNNSAIHRDHRSLQEEEEGRHDRLLQFVDPRSVTVKSQTYQHYPSSSSQNQHPPHPQEDTLFMVVNTPKCGTGGLTNSLVLSFGCHRMEYESSLNKGYHYDCPQHHIRILRTHGIQDAYSTLEEIGSHYSKCTMITAVRDPLQWIASWFMEKHKREFCPDPSTPSEKKKMKLSRQSKQLKRHARESPSDMIRYYRSWIHDQSENLERALQHLLPHLLHEFGSGTTLKDQWNTVSNQGYSWIPTEPQPPNNPKCQLLLLKMEDSSSWPSILQDQIPGIVYERNGSRQEQCPLLADHYRAIQNYRWTPQEKRRIMGKDNKYNQELFELYGHLE